MVATASKNELMKQDVIVPESDLQAMLAIDATSKACASQLIAYASNEAAKALIVAKSIKQFRNLLTDAVMSDIMELQGSPLGFKTDKRYEVNVVRDCVVQAFMRGLRVTGNEMNIIAGNLYVTKEGFERLLAEMPGLTNLRVQVGVPQNLEGGALVPAKADWLMNGIPDSITWEKSETADYRIPIRVNSAMGVDAILGKARSKVLRNIYARISGTKLAVEAEADEVEEGEVVA